FDMGGAGDLLALSLSVPPWEELHELTPSELRLTNVATTAKVADVLPRAEVSVPMADLAPKTVQERFVSSTAESEAQAVRSTKTAEVVAPTGSVAAAPAK